MPNEVSNVEKGILKEPLLVNIASHNVGLHNIRDNNEQVAFNLMQIL